MSAPTAERRLADLHRVIREGAGLAADTSERVLVEAVQASLHWTRELLPVLRVVGVATRDALIAELRRLRAANQRLLVALGPGPAGVSDVESLLGALRADLGLPASASLAEVRREVAAIVADRSAVVETLRAAGVPVELGPSLAILSLLRRLKAGG